MERERIGYLLAAVTAPLVLFVALLARPQMDKAWENHPAHFWLVLGAAIAATALGFSVTTAARRRQDARLLLISLAFIVSAAFLGLHALATPGVLLGPNAGFELATPVGLVLAAGFAAASSLELSGHRADAVLRIAPALIGVLALLVAAWAIVSLAELPPLDDTNKNKKPFSSASSSRSSSSSGISTMHQPHHGPQKLISTAFLFDRSASSSGSSTPVSGARLSAPSVRPIAGCAS